MVSDVVTTAHEDHLHHCRCAISSLTTTTPCHPACCTAGLWVPAARSSVEVMVPRLMAWSDQPGDGIKCPPLPAALPAGPSPRLAGSAVLLPVQS